MYWCHLQAPWVPGVLWIEENVWDKRIPKDVLQKYRRAVSQRRWAIHIGCRRQLR